jgi:hypothetical protein
MPAVNEILFAISDKKLQTWYVPGWHCAIEQLPAHWLPVGQMACCRAETR